MAEDEVVVAMVQAISGIGLTDIVKHHVARRQFVRVETLSCFSRNERTLRREC